LTACSRRSTIRPSPTLTTPGSPHEAESRCDSSPVTSARAEFSGTPRTASKADISSSCFAVVNAYSCAPAAQHAVAADISQLGVPGIGSLLAFNLGILSHRSALLLAAERQSVRYSVPRQAFMA
jgi:hypothetical protein